MKKQEQLNMTLILALIPQAFSHFLNSLLALFINFSFISIYLP